MSQDFSNSKPNPHALYPQDVSITRGEGAAGLDRVEPLITVRRMKEEFLFGIPLVSYTTQEALSDRVIRQIIKRAITNFETKYKVDVFPVQRTIRKQFDRTKMLQGFNQLNLGVANIQSIEEIAIRAVNTKQFPNNQNPPDANEDGNVIFIWPLDWITMDLASKGIIHIYPLSTATFSGVVPPQSGAAIPLLAQVSQLQWMPSFWFVRCTTGFQKNSIPAPVNEMIGWLAAKEILSMIGPTRNFNSASIGLDAASQSVSGPGHQLYTQRMQDIDQNILRMEPTIKSLFGFQFYMSNV